MRPVMYGTEKLHQKLLWRFSAETSNCSKFSEHKCFHEMLECNNVNDEIIIKDKVKNKDKNRPKDM